MCCFLCFFLVQFAVSLSIFSPSSATDSFFSIFRRLSLAAYAAGRVLIGQRYTVFVFSAWWRLLFQQRHFFLFAFPLGLDMLGRHAPARRSVSEKGFLLAPRHGFVSENGVSHFTKGPFRTSNQVYSRYPSNVYSNVLRFSVVRHTFHDNISGKKEISIELLVASCAATTHAVTSRLCRHSAQTHSPLKCVFVVSCLM